MRGTVVLVLIAGFLAALLGVLVLVPILHARHLHDREVASERLRGTALLTSLGLAPAVVKAGIDGGGSGSAECGVHVVYVVPTKQSLAAIKRKLARVTEDFALEAYEGPRPGAVVVVSSEVAAGGKDAWFDTRCSGNIPYSQPG